MKRIVNYNFYYVDLAALFQTNGRNVCMLASFICKPQHIPFDCTVYVPRMHVMYA